MSESLLEVRDLVKHFAARSGPLAAPRAPVRAVDGVSFEVRPGEALGLVGESGSGKTTTARLVAALLEPTSGSVRLRGRELTGLGRRAARALRREVQMIFQDPASSLNPRRRVGTLVADPLVVHGLVSDRAERERAVGRLLERVGLDAGHAGRHPHELSGGQRQRVAVARALALEPRLLVADEPVSALDASTGAGILELLRELRRERGLTLVLIAHDLAVVKHTCDRVAVMHAGRIVEMAPVPVLFGAPAHPYTAALLEAAPVPEPRSPKAPPPPA